MRKMRKFAEGGSDKYKAKYDRKVADIKSDYDKAMKGKTGKAADVAKAKYEQRMADAKDDLAKWTKSDRTETRAAEKSAERNLSMTRKFGAMKSAVKADDVAKVSSTDDVLKSAPKPQMPSKASETKPTRRAAPAPTRRAPVKQEEKPKATLPATFAQRRGTINMPPAPKSEITFPRADVSRAAPRAGAAPVADSRAAKLARLKTAAEAPGASQFAKDRYRMAKETGMYASGGTVKKKPTPPRKPLPPTAQELRNRDKENKSIEKAKPSAADVAAIGRGNRSSGMKKGGSVMGKATKFGAAMKKKSADTMGRAMVKKAGGGKCYAKGGSVSSRADGVAHKGKTKGKMVTMSKGGKY